MKNKKAAVGSAFNWIIAILVIFMILLITNVFVFTLFVTKGKSKVNIYFGEDESNKRLQTKFLNFLNTKILINNKNEKIIDVIKTDLDEEKINKIKEELDKLCNLDNGYILEIPGNIIKKEGLEYNFVYKEISHKTIIYGEIAVIKLLIREDCL